MYQIGDYVIYGNYGLCVVKDISTLDMDGVPKDRQYYFLTPVSGAHGIVYTPVDNGKVVIRNMMSKDMALELISDVNSIEKIDAINDKIREEKYKECIKSCEGREWMRLILTIRDRMAERIEQGKKVTSLDERYMKMAEDYLYTELSAALEIKPEEVPEYIDRQNSIK